MTEVDWFSCRHPRRMLEYLGGQASNRKMRLFGVACARRTAPLWSDKQPLALLNAAELLADGFAPVEKCHTFCCGAASGMHFTYAAVTDCLAASGAEVAVLSCARAVSSLGRAACDPFAHPKRLRVYMESVRDESAVQAELFRDIFASPFHPVAFDLAWRTDTVLALAREMYETRDFSAMPILADALQDARCEDDDILNHCRDANATHARGCWVVDVVLGNE